MRLQLTEKYRDQWRYHNEFDIVLAAGLEGYEIQFKETEFGKKCERDPQLRLTTDKITQLLLRDGEFPNKVPLYDGMIELARKYGKKMFVPYKEKDFSRLWQKREIEIFRDILVPEADFVIGDVYDFSDLRGLAIETLNKGSNIMLLLDENSHLIKLLASRDQYEIVELPYKRTDDKIGLYPLIGKLNEEVLLKFEHFLRQFYGIAS